MASEKEKFIRELANDKGLSNNTLAKVFAHNPTIEISNKSNFFDNVRDLFFRLKDGEIEIDLEGFQEPAKRVSEEIKDYRIKKRSFQALKDTHLVRFPLPLILPQMVNTRVL